ncbi:MAG: hypothetical protein ACLR1R_10145 [Ruminococcus callidus]
MATMVITRQQQVIMSRMKWQLTINAGFVGALLGLYGRALRRRAKIDSNFSWEEEIMADEYYTAVKCSENDKHAIQH